MKKTTFLFLTVFFLLGASSLSLAQGWQWQNPLPQGNTVHSADAIDANVIWCGTAAGVILYSPDGGQAWQFQQTPSDAWFYGIDFVNALSGWAVGVEESGGDLFGVIVGTRDGGQHWELQYREEFHTRKTVAFLNRDTGWAGGDNILLFTDNGGETWQDFTQKEGLGYQIINSISIIDSSWIWIAGQYYLAHTEDGGETWIQDTSDVAFNVFSKVQFVDSSHGWILEKFTTNNLYRTIDGGQTWLLSNDIIEDRIRDIHFINTAEGWAQAQSGVYRTQDGGENWHLITEQSLAHSEGKFLFVDATTGYSWEDFFSFYKTSDGGVTWDDLTTTSVSEINALSAVDFIDKFYGWAVGDRGTIISTWDGGKTWTAQNSGTENRLTDVQFYSKNIGWASGFSTDIFRTENGGATWQSIATPVVGTPNRSICFVDSLNGWLVGGGVLEPGWILHSDNSGLNWRRQTPGLLPRLMDVFFLDPSHGWVVGDSGYIAHTSDGGLNWQMQSSTGSGRLEKVYFTSPEKGWIIYGGGNVLFTTNGGSEWQKMFVGGFEGGLEDITFSDQQHGWLCGGIGVLFSTQNAGLTWQEQFSGTRNALLAIDFVNSEEGWVVGTRGTILMTSSGGVTSIEEKTQKIVSPVSFELLGNYPNPFNPATKIRYRIAKAGSFRLTVYNVKGEVVQTLVSEHRQPGTYSVEWSGMDDSSRPVASGVYYYRLHNNRSSLSGKMLLLR